MAQTVENAEATNPGSNQNIFSYRHEASAAPTGWMFFDAAENGATDITPDFHAEFKIDMVMGPVVAGEFRQTGGSATVTWPFTEHAFLYEGEVALTNLDTGEKTLYGPGDGWVVKQGTRTIWAVLKPMRKSFFQYIEA